MTISDCAEYFGLGLVLGYGMRWVMWSIRAIFRVPSVVIGRE